MPGQILLSPAYFGDLSELEVDGSALNDPRFLRYLIVPDEPNLKTSDLLLLTGGIQLFALALLADLVSKRR